ncbi:MAG: DUF5666 domain-containing protein [bacterium]|nr:DUF5666 domain-containing protein [bacterium]
MKKILSIVLAISLLYFAAAPVFAQQNNFMAAQMEILKKLQNQLKELQKRALETRQEGKEVKKEIQETKKEIKSEAKEKVKELKNIADIPAVDLKAHLSLTELGTGKIEALIKAGVISEIAGDSASLKVKIFNTEYKVQISSDTKIVRHYWGTSQISEFSVGDVVNVHGLLDANDQSVIAAKTIRNVSIQQRHGVFSGEIKLITPPDTFIFQTKERGGQTVQVGGETRIFFGRESKSFSDLAVGMEGVVRGIWDKTLSKIQALLITMRPLIAPSPSPSPTPTPTPIETPTPTPTPTSTPTE